MLKPTANYRMSKQTKRSLATSAMIDPHFRGEQKRLMIQAELFAQQQPPRREKGKRDFTGSTAEDWQAGYNPI